MNTTKPTREPRIQGGLPELLEALYKIYQRIGLSVEDARAATFADAEIFAPHPAWPGGPT